MDMDILKSMFSCLACPDCFHQNVTIEDINSKKKGLARYVALKCLDWFCTILLYIENGRLR